MFAVRCPVLLLQILRCAQKDITVTIDAAASCHPETSRFSVILNGAVGEVKDLESHIASPHWQLPVIPKEICSLMMP